ncbi:MAG: GNAT family protein [Myxococcota bacterium]|nr:GNAT family protein [Myxococcota bacterium]
MSKKTILADNSLSRRTSRLEIRPLVLRDYRAWLHAHRTMSPPKSPFDSGPISEEKLTHKRFREQIKKCRGLREADRFYSFGVFLKESGELVGYTSLIVVFRVDLQTAFIGWGTYNQYWRRGYARESVQATIAIAFEELDLHRIEAGIEPRNRASVALAKAVGMRREGIQKRYIYTDQKWVDLVAYALVAEDLGIEYGAPRIRADFCLENL